MSVFQMVNAQIITLEGELATTLNGPKVEGTNLGFIKAVDEAGAYCGTCSWAEWDAVVIPTSGTYKVTYYTSGFADSVQIKLVVGDVDKGLTNILPTGGWSTYLEADTTTDLTAGTHKVRVYFTSMKQQTGFLCNFDKMTIEPAGTSNVNALESNSLKVYPNPVSSVLTVENNEAGLISLYSLTGAMVYSKVADGQKQNIDVSSFNKGVYVLKFESKFGTKASRVIIK